MTLMLMLLLDATMKIDKEETKKSIFHIGSITYGYKLDKITKIPSWSQYHYENKYDQP